MTATHLAQRAALRRACGTRTAQRVIDIGCEGESCEVDCDCEYLHEDGRVTLCAVRPVGDGGTNLRNILSAALVRRIEASLLIEVCAA